MGGLTTRLFNLAGCSEIQIRRPADWVVLSNETGKSNEWVTIIIGELARTHSLLRLSVRFCWPAWCAVVLCAPVVVCVRLWYILCTPFARFAHCTPLPTRIYFSRPVNTSGIYRLCCIYLCCLWSKQKYARLQRYVILQMLGAKAVFSDDEGRHLDWAVRAENGSRVVRIISGTLTNSCLRLLL